MFKPQQYHDPLLSFNFKFNIKNNKQKSCSIETALTMCAGGGGGGEATLAKLLSNSKFTNSIMLKMAIKCLKLLKMIPNSPDSNLTVT